MKVFEKRTLTLFAICIGYFGCTMIFAAIQASTSIANPQETIFSLMLKGGPVMIPLGICSLIALAVAIERWITLSPKKIAPKNFFLNITENGKDKDLSSILLKCSKSKTTIAQIVQSGLSKWQKTNDRDLAEKIIEDNASRFVYKYKRSLRPLLHIGAISPLLGLLGTIIGMINAFQNVASVEQYGKAARLASGIYEAMVTTATGLIVAIPVLIVYYYLADRMDKCSDKIEDECNAFLDEFIHVTKK
ncbi:MAG TPA: hypothetical protein DD381_01655 [Lentisphaeria bacterium]|nr:MAG: hypothetical protein A2X47_10375 [Lentisphaerae bacterium GWF2_38_69]HBM15047.1 hypothetical protein [Lentisphaeria bacterium]